MGRNVLPLAALALAIAIAGCADTARQVRKLTYPQEFRYYEPGEIDASMHKLAAMSEALNTRLRGGGPTDDEGRAEIVMLLDKMVRAASDLESNAEGSNRPALDWHLDTFLRDLEQARADAKRDPPNYFLAGSVAGSCMSCHSRGS